MSSYKAELLKMVGANLALFGGVGVVVGVVAGGALGCCGTFVGGPFGTVIGGAIGCMGPVAFALLMTASSSIGGAIGLKRALDKDLANRLDAPAPATPEQATIRIQRTSQTFGKIRVYDVHVDGERVATVGDGGVVDIPVEPGGRKVELRLDWMRSEPHEVDAVAGERVALQASSPIEGWRLWLISFYQLDGRCMELRQVPTDQGA